MKVPPVLLQLLLLLLSDSIADYASAQQQLAHAEVSHDTSRKFGTKLAGTGAQEAELQRAVPTQTTNRPVDLRQSSSTASVSSTTSAPAPHIARRYEKPVTAQAQLVAQDNGQRQQQRPRQLSEATERRSARERLSAAAGAQQRPNSHNAKKALSEAARRQVNSTTATTTLPARAASRARHSNAPRSASVGTAKTTSTTTQRAATTEAPRPTNSRKSKTRKNVKSKANISATSTSATTTTSTSSTTLRPPPPLNPNTVLTNPFNFLTSSFWSFSNPSSTPKPKSTKRPPKKYTPPTSAPAATTAAKQKKLTYQKPKSTTTTTTTTTSKPHQDKSITTPKKSTTTDGPFRIALPTFNFFNAPTQEAPEADGAREKEKRNTLQNLRERFVCPRESEVRFQLFPKICKIDEDCRVWNREELCCEIFGAKSCVSGIPKPLEETSHSPILGLIPRKCPSRPLAELWWQVQECETDMDCWPRVCCPDGSKRYCRTSQPELETVPVPVKRSFNYLSEYLECTPAPPPVFDLHPKTCGSTLDCFPNVCCQEAGQRYCRPPKKSVLTLMANFLNVDFVKRLTQNIVIK